MIMLSKFMAFLIILQLWFLSTMLSYSSRDDMITSLPGQPPANFNQYAGYITVDVDDKRERALFYYFVEAESDPQTKPLVLWLNGGPGCSSVGGGGFSGHGPFVPDQVDGLIRNNLSWNKEANVLFLESPAGVGFSYSSNKSYYGFTNDEMTARDNLMFLFGWFEKYPKYKNANFFITGVSYGGHFVPQLAKLILQSRLKTNLKGIMIGNPLLDFDITFNSAGDYLWSHGLISDSTYTMLISACNVSQVLRGFMEGNSSACLQVYHQGIEEIGKIVNLYEILTDVCIESVNRKGSRNKNCLGNEIEKYLNRKDVQEALHAKLVGLDKWSFCNRGIGYNERDSMVPTIPLLGELVNAGIRVMVYSGDQDVIMPFIGTRTLVNLLAKALRLDTTVPYQTWLQDKQVGGWTQVYGNILSFATVRGGGHDTASSQPERTFLLLSTFLKGELLPLSD